MVFRKRHLKTTSTQCTRERKSTASGGGNTINTNATTEVPVAAAEVHTTAADHAAAARTAAAAGVHTTAAITATAGGLCFQTSLYCNYIYRAPHLWQDTFLQSSFAALSDDDMASPRENLVALQTLATAV